MRDALAMAIPQVERTLVKSTSACARATATCASCWCISVPAPTTRTSSRRCLPRCGNSSTRPGSRRRCRCRPRLAAVARSAGAGAAHRAGGVFQCAQTRAGDAGSGWTSSSSPNGASKCATTARAYVPGRRAPRRDPCRHAHHGGARRTDRRQPRRPFDTGAGHVDRADIAAAVPAVPQHVDPAEALSAAMTAMSSTRLHDSHPRGRRPHAISPRPDRAAVARSACSKSSRDAADAAEAQRRARELQPDLILLDNHLPGVNGVDALPALREAAPAARILMLTVSEDEQDLAAALRNGACGYLLKTMEGDALSRAIVRAMRGESVVAEEMTGKLVAAYRRAAAASRAAETGAIRRRRSRSCLRASGKSCAGSHVERATRRSRASSASPRPRSRSTCSTSCASSMSPRACRQRLSQPSTGWVDLESTRRSLSSLVVPERCRPRGRIVLPHSATPPTDGCRSASLPARLGA